MTRVQRLSVAAVALTLVQVAWGAFTRGSGSGYGCQDRWPLCEGGVLQVGDLGGLLPRPEFEMVVEWLHRWIALVVLVLLVWLAVRLWRRHRDVPRVTWPAIGAVAVVLVQSGVGALVVMTDLDADLVTVHLVGATFLLGLLTFGAVNSFFLLDRRAAPTTAVRIDPRWTRLLALGAGGVAVTLVLGSTVHNQYVGGWPLVGGELVPGILGDSRVVDLHYAHRAVAGIVFAYLAWLAWQAVRRDRPRTEVTAVHLGVALFVVNIGLGAVHVVTEVSSVVAIVAHLGVAASAWTALVAAWTLARRHHELAPVGGPGDGPHGRPDRGARVEVSA